MCTPHTLPMFFSIRKPIVHFGVFSPVIFSDVFSDGHCAPVPWCCDLCPVSSPSCMLMGSKSSVLMEGPRTTKAAAQQMPLISSDGLCCCSELSSQCSLQPCCPGWAELFLSSSQTGDCRWAPACLVGMGQQGTALNERRRDGGWM